MLSIGEVGYYQDVNDFNPVEKGSSTSPIDNIVSEIKNIVNNSSMQDSVKNAKTKEFLYQTLQIPKRLRKI